MDKFRFEVEHTCVEEEEDARADIEFYETIQAPKFVDFTRPNHFCPDDRYWFCSRLGCNQKHEEETNSEAIYKDFVLRVMAARSPNVRFQRALTRKPPSDSKKYPMSVPPKPSKSRIPRLALAASISKKLVVNPEKATNIPTPTKPASTPKAKARLKIVPAKYMTSPRKKIGGSPNLKVFQSVRNPKNTSITMQKNRLVAKALLFSSPKKSVKVKTPEPSTPVTKLCEGVKKLAIRSVKKGIVEKPLKVPTSVRKLLPSKIVAFKANQQDKSSDDSASQERPGDDTSDMEIDEKSRDGSLDLCTEMVKLGSEEKHDGSSNDCDSGTFKKEPTSSSERPLTAESLTNDLISVASSEQKCSEQQNVKTIQDLNLTVQNNNERCTTEDDKENASNSNDLTTEDDQENALNSNDIRKVNGNNLSKHGVPVKSKVKKNQKLQHVEKISEDKCPVAITNEVKYKKLKPTNPKPFRLRTDERGILKEANLERKANFHETSTTTSENSQNIENGVSDITEKVSKKVEDKTLKKVRFISVKSKYKKTPKEAEPLSVLCSENKMGRAKPSFHKQIVRPQRKNESQVKPRGVTLTEETATTTKMESRQEPCKEVSAQTNHKEVSTYHKPASQRRKPTTVPREPKFQTLNTPKSCIRNTHKSV